MSCQTFPPTHLLHIAENPPQFCKTLHLPSNRAICIEVRSKQESFFCWWCHWWRGSEDGELGDRLEIDWNGTNFGKLFSPIVLEKLNRTGGPVRWGRPWLLCAAGADGGLRDSVDWLRLLLFLCVWRKDRRSYSVRLNSWWQMFMSSGWNLTKCYFRFWSSSPSNNEIHHPT